MELDFVFLLFCGIGASYVIALSSNFITCKMGGVLGSSLGVELKLETSGQAMYWENIFHREGEWVKQDGAGKSQTRKP